MDIAGYFLRNRTNTLVLTLTLVVAGLFAYKNLGRLEDPEFTIKEAVVVTSYPGASAGEVEQEVSDVIERAVQQLGQLKRVESRSEPGLSSVSVSIKDNFDKDTLPQVWDELRRKVGDAQKDLPPGAGTPMIVDDYGDVFGVFLAITGDGYTPREIEDFAEYLKRELMLVRDVAKVDLFGTQPEAVYIEISRDKLSQFGLTKEQIYGILAGENLVSDAGRARVGNEDILLRPTGQFTSIREMEELLVGTRIDQSGGQRLIYLRDVARLTRQPVTPPSMIFRVDGRPAVALAVSTVKGGNVVSMGDALNQRLKELEPTFPAGMEFHRISFQSEIVSEAIDGFIVGLVEAVAIVVIVLLFFMGLRSGLIIGAVLVVTIVGTFIFMQQQGVLLERISLGALIIALGMLVDNAIVVTDGILVRIQKGEDRVEAARAVVAQNQMPLLGATVVAITAFAAIGTSQDSTGEYCRSLFQVILISLMFSWVTAVTITPVACVMFLKAGGSGGSQQDPYDIPVYRMYRRLLGMSLRWRWAVLAAMVVLLLASVWGFGRVRQSFFPASTRPQFMVDLWLPEGTSIDETARQAAEVGEYLEGIEGVTQVVTSVGRGLPRFILTYVPMKPNSAYAFFLVSVDDHRRIEQLVPEIQRRLEKDRPHTIPMVYKFMLGPGEATRLKVRLMGPDMGVLRDLSDQVMAAMHAHGNIIGIQTETRERIKEYRPVVSEAQARRNGLDRSDFSNLLKEYGDGRRIGVYRQGDELLPIMARVPDAERDDIRDIENLQIYSPAADAMIPLKQVVSGFETGMVDALIQRRDRTRMIMVLGDPRTGEASEALKELIPDLGAITVPPGYRLELAGEYEKSREAQGALFSKLPFFLLLMILIVILLFNAFRQAIVIWLCVPLAVIGVTIGLLATDQAFGFMALLGLLSLSGMLIKNAIVLIDQTDINIREGMKPWDAVIDAGVSRSRPVLMAAATTVLGMIPLLGDAFFVSMAVTIMAGLTFATILTLVVVPVLYAAVFRISEES